MISLLQCEFESPAENLAADEALLELCDEKEDHAGFLRFYESQTYFVVLGYGKDPEQEVIRSECERLRIPVLRRCSGGGTVLQGPGCFNYSLVLPLSYAAELESITGANRFIMRRIRETVTQVAQKNVEVRGFTDLVYEGRKFSGNAQRRKRRCLLFHGCFLLDFDLPLITRTLALPVHQPEYRARRSHQEFLTNLPLDRRALRDNFLKVWEASLADADSEFRALTEQLATTKYRAE